MNNDELLILVTGGTNHTMAEEHLLYRKALSTVLELCAIPDEVTIGDKGLFNSGRNSMRDKIVEAIERNFWTMKDKIDSLLLIIFPNELDRYEWMKGLVVSFKMSPEKMIELGREQEVIDYLIFYIDGPN